jgi:hypothetical protein
VQNRSQLNKLHVQRKQLIITGKPLPTEISTEGRIRSSYLRPGPDFMVSG